MIAKHSLPLEWRGVCGDGLDNILTFHRLTTAFICVFSLKKAAQKQRFFGPSNVGLVKVRAGEGGAVGDERMPLGKDLLCKMQGWCAVRFARH